MKNFVKGTLELKYRDMRYEFNPLAIVGAMISAAKAKATGNPLSAMDAVRKAVGSVKGVPQEGQLAYELIFTALINATVETAKCIDQEALDARADLGAQTIMLQDRLHSLLGNELYIAEQFFEAPDEWNGYTGYLDILSIYYGLVLGETLEKPDIRTAFRNNYLKQLDELYRSNKDRYTALQIYFQDTPFSERLVVLRGIDAQIAVVANRYTAELPNSNVTLQEIYIPPRYRVYIPEDKREPLHYAQSYLEVDADLNKEILDRLQQILSSTEVPQKSFCLVLGQPGQGKSSFCYRLFHDLQEAGIAQQLSATYIPLGRTADIKAFFPAPVAYLRANAPELFGKGPSLLVLDGLDEAIINRKTVDGDVENLIQAISDWNGDPKLSDSKLFVLLLSRKHYIVPETFPHDVGEVYDLAPLDNGAQRNLAQKLISSGLANGLTIEDFDRLKLRSSDLQAVDELLDQPVTLQLILRSGVDVEHLRNRGDLYGKLFTILIDRTWEDRQLGVNLGKDRLRKLLRSLAHAIYGSGELHISRREAHALFEEMRKPLEKVFKVANREVKIEQLFRDLLMLFYFEEREIGSEDTESEQAIEFYHKTLAEYLAMEEVHERLLRITTIESGSSISINELLPELYDIFTPTMLEVSAVEFLEHIVENDGRRTPEQLSVGLDLMQGCLVSDFIHADIAAFGGRVDRLSEGGTLKVATNTCYGLYTWLKAGNRPRIFNEAKVWKKLLPFLSRHASVYGQQVKFTYEAFDTVDLPGAHFVQSTFDDSKWERLVVSGGDFESSSFADVEANNCMFQGVSFNCANFSSACFVNCEFVGCTFESATIDSSTFKSCRFFGCDFRTVTFYKNTFSANTFKICDFDGARVDSKVWLALMSSNNLAFVLSGEFYIQSSDEKSNFVVGYK